MLKSKSPPTTPRFGHTPTTRSDDAFPKNAKDCKTNISMKRWDCISKAVLVTLGIGIIYEKGKKALDTVMMAANGNQEDTGVANHVYEKINEYFQSAGKNQINVKYCKN